MNGEVIWLCHAEVQIHAELPFFSGFYGTVLSKFEDPLGRYLILKALSFCVVGRLGRKEKRALGARWEGEREKRGSCLFPLPIVPGALSIFSIIAIGIISRSLCGGESPEGGDQGQIVCAENIYAPTKDKDIIKFLNNLRTILQKENLDDEEIWLYGVILNVLWIQPSIKKRWYNVIEEVSYWNHWLCTWPTWFG